MLGVNSKALVKLDNLCDYAPGVSSLSSLVNLIQKIAVIPLMKESSITNSSYYTHLKEKSFLRCIILLIPGIGNLIVSLYDFFKKDDLNSAILFVVKNPERLQSMSKEFLNNESNMSILVSLNGLALKYAGEKVKRNESIVREAVDQNPEALQFASLHLRNNGPFMLSMVQKDGSLYGYAGSGLKNHKSRWILEATSLYDTKKRLHKRA